MNIDTFFTDHWQHIEDERIARYEQMFLWRPEQAQLLAPAGIEAGHTVADFGCGPGFMTRAIAELIGPAGHAYGLDINASFVANANTHVDNPDNLSYHLIEDGKLPLADASVDRVLCKNVLEYVPDLAATLTELHRVLRPDGRLHAVDSDWGFVIVEPWSKAEVDEFFAAAAPRVQGTLHWPQATGRTTCRRFRQDAGFGIDGCRSPRSHVPGAAQHGQLHPPVRDAVRGHPRTS